MPLLLPGDLKTHLYAEIVSEITRSDADITTRAIDKAEAEVKSYLNRYDVGAMFVTTNTDQYLRSIVTDVACWQLIKLANPNVNLELFRTMYEDAVKTLEKIQAGKQQPAWPPRPNDENTAIDDAGQVEYTSNSRRTSNY